MRGLLPLIAAATLSVASVLSVGCADRDPAANCCPHCACSDADCCPPCDDGDVFGPARCPDGYCPSPHRPTGAIEVGDERESEINKDALLEEKGGPGCPTCPTSPPSKRPTATPADTASYDPGSDVPREGVFSCHACKRPAVGREWKEIWADDGTSLTFLCERCFARLDADQLETALETYLDAAEGLKPSQRFYARAAIRELAKSR